GVRRPRTAPAPPGPRPRRRHGCAHGRDRGSRRCRQNGRPRARGAGGGLRLEGSLEPMITPDLDLQIPAELGALHFVGIGGSGMSGIARLFLEAGHRVTASDRSDSAAIRELQQLGADIRIGHDAAHVGDADTVGVTGALWLDNPEYQEALRRGIPVLHRAHALAWLVRGTRLIAVAGSHGKSTSTGMIVTALREIA